MFGAISHCPLSIVHRPNRGGLFAEAEAGTPLDGECPVWGSLTRFHSVMSQR